MRDVAEAAGVSTKTVVQLEYGRQRPHYKSMRAISAALGVAAGEVRSSRGCWRNGGRSGRAKAPPREGIR